MKKYLKLISCILGVELGLIGIGWVMCHITEHVSFGQFLLLVHSLVLMLFSLISGITKGIDL